MIGGWVLQLYDRGPHADLCGTDPTSNPRKALIAHANGSRDLRLRGSMAAVGLLAMHC